MDRSDVAIRIVHVHLNYSPGDNRERAGIKCMEVPTVFNAVLHPVYQSLSLERHLQSHRAECNDINDGTETVAVNMSSQRS